jgi:hypothetical protein
MKSRYLFPLVYIVTDAISLLFINVPMVPILVSSLRLPSSFVLEIISRTIGVPTDPAYFAYLVGVGTILQIFLLGLLWGLSVDKIRKFSQRTRVVII